MIDEAAGLSPRVRGNPRTAARRGPRGGSIPASAGEPGHVDVDRGHGKVYPRECGGTASFRRAWRHSPGLSPRVRGNRGSRCANVAGGGSIPASAGEPQALIKRDGDDRVYPRECGGTQAPTAARRSSQGLSPRVRGNRTSGSRGARLPGSIPASAGEPLVVPREAPQLGVYPRECGGTTSDLMRVLFGLGLSPRVRGNRPGPPVVLAGVGSIPASAGEPGPP